MRSKWHFALAVVTAISFGVYGCNRASDQRRSVGTQTSPRQTKVDGIGELAKDPDKAAKGDIPTLSVGEVDHANERRYVSIHLRLPDTMSITKETTLLAIVGVGETGGPVDEYGPPQSFALKETGHQIAPHHFRVSVALPAKTVRVRFILRGKEVLHDETLEI